MAVRSIREDDELNDLIEAMHICSPGDLSVLEAMIFTDGEPKAITAIGSPNDRLMTLLSKRGWMREVEFASLLKDPSQPAPGALISKAFVLLPEGRIPIYQLTSRFGPVASGKANPAKSKTQMLDQMASRVQSFARSDVLVPMGLVADFDMETTLKIFGFLIAKGVNDLAQAQDKSEAIDLIAKWAKQLLANKKS